MRPQRLERHPSAGGLSLCRMHGTAPLRRRSVPLSHAAAKRSGLLSDESSQKVCPFVSPPSVTLSVAPCSEEVCPSVSLSLESDPNAWNGTPPQEVWPFIGCGDPANGVSNGQLICRDRHRPQYTAAQRKGLSHCLRFPENQTPTFGRAPLRKRSGLLLGLNLSARSHPAKRSGHSSFFTLPALQPSRTGLSHFCERSGAHGATSEVVCLFVSGSSSVLITNQTPAEATPPSHSEKVCPFVSPSLRIKFQPLEGHLSARGLSLYPRFGRTGKMVLARRSGHLLESAVGDIRKVCPIVCVVPLPGTTTIRTDP